MSTGQAAGNTNRGIVGYNPAQSMRPLFFRGMETFCTFDPTTAEGAELLVKATMTEVKDLSDMINKDIYVQHIFCHPASSIDQNTGAASDFTRTVIIDAKGDMYQCGSDGVLKSLEIFRLMRRDPPWNPPIKCEVKLQKLSGQRQWMTLMPDLKAIGANFKRPGGREPDKQG